MVAWGRADPARVARLGVFRLKAAKVSGNVTSGSKTRDETGVVGASRLDERSPARFNAGGPVTGVAGRRI